MPGASRRSARKEARGRLRVLHLVGGVLRFLVPHRSRVAPPRHLAADFPDLLRRQHVRGGRKELAILDADVLVVHRFQRGQMSVKGRPIGLAESAFIEPAAYEGVDRLVSGVGGPVIALEARDGPEGGTGGGILRRAEAREEALFLVGRVPRRGGGEVGERAVKLGALGRRQRFRGAPRDRRQYREEVLDPAMAVAQQAERFVEAVVGACADSKKHAVSLAEAWPGAYDGDHAGPDSDTMLRSPWPRSTCRTPATIVAGRRSSSSCSRW